MLKAKGRNNDMVPDTELYMYVNIEHDEGRGLVSDGCELFKKRGGILTSAKCTFRTSAPTRHLQHRPGTEGRKEFASFSLLVKIGGGAGIATHTM